MLISLGLWLIGWILMTPPGTTFADHYALGRQRTWWKPEAHPIDMLITLLIGISAGAVAGVVLAT